MCKGFGRFFEKKLGKKLSNGYYFELLSSICALDGIFAFRQSTHKLFMRELIERLLPRGSWRRRRLRE